MINDNWQKYGAHMMFWQIREMVKLFEIEIFKSACTQKLIILFRNCKWGSFCEKIRCEIRRKLKNSLKIFRGKKIPIDLKDCKKCPFTNVKK